MCTRPIKAYWNGDFTESGKKRMRFSPSNKTVEEFTLPCGQCIECRLKHANEWSTRCMLEARSHKHNYFVTLTYDDDHLIDILDNVGIDNLVYPPTVLDSHLRKFIKDLRSHMKYDFDVDGIRFFACSEYGDKSMRPHYHLILFNCPIPDLTYYKTSAIGDVYYNSDYINKIWTKGYAVIGDVTTDSCRYVAKYVTKKATGKNADYFSNLMLFPEKLYMSRRPGIGTEYFKAHASAFLENDSIYVDGKPQPIPNSYLRSIESIESSLVADIKEQRSRKENIKRYEVNKLTSVPEWERIQRKEKNSLLNLNERSKV